MNDWYCIYDVGQDDYFPRSDCQDLGVQINKNKNDILRLSKVRIGVRAGDITDVKLHLNRLKAGTMLLEILKEAI